MNNNQNPNKRRLNFSTQQRRGNKRQKLNPQNTSNRGRGRGTNTHRGRGRGQRSIARRGRGSYTYKPKQPTKPSLPSQPRTVANTKAATSTNTIPNVFNMGLSRTIQNTKPPTTIPSNPPTQTVNAKQQEIARLRAAALATQQSSPQKPTSSTNTVIFGTMMAEQIENENRKKALLMQQPRRLRRRQPANKPVAAPTVTNIASPSQDTAALSPTSMAALKQKALSTMMTNKPAITQQQQQKQSSAALQNQKRREMLKRLKQAQGNKPIVTTAKPVVIASPVANIKSAALNPNASVFQPKPVQIVSAQQVSTGQIAPRKLQSYRKGSKSVNNQTFTTTVFDNNHKVVKTTISTNTNTSNATTITPPKPTQVPVISPLPQISTTKVTSSDLPPLIQTAPIIKAKPIDLTQKPAKVTATQPIPPKVDDRLPADAANWSCQFCTFNNENNTSFVCGCCNQRNYIKTPPLPSQPDPASKPKQLIPISTTHKPSINKPIPSQLKPVNVKQSTITTVNVSKPIVTTTTVKPKAPMISVSKPKAPPPIQPPIATISTFKPQPSKPIKSEPVAKPNIFASNKSSNVADKAAMDAIWAQRDKAILQSKQRQIPPKVPAQQVNTMKPKPSAMFKRPVMQKSATQPKVVSVNKPILQSELQRKRVNVQKPNMVKSRTAEAVQRSNQFQQRVTGIVKPKPVMIKEPVFTLKDYWKVHTNHKLSEKSLDVLVKETDEFIKKDMEETKRLCGLVGIEYVDPWNMNIECEMVNVQKDLEWTKRVCKENNVRWNAGFDLNRFESVVSQCNQ